MNTIHVAGVGPGDPSYLTAQAMRLISEADVVAGFNLPLETAAGHIKGKQVLLTYKNQEEELAKLAQRAAAGKRCVVCAQGDASFSGRELIDRVRAVWPQVEVVPGVSSVQVVCARTGLEMERALFLTFHKRGDTEPDRRELIAAALEGRRDVIALPRPWDFMPAAMAHLLVDEGVSPKRAALVYQRLTLPGEQVTETDLGALAALPDEFSDLSIFLLRRSDP